MTNNYENALEHYQKIDSLADTFYNKLASNTKFKRLLHRNNNEADSITNFNVNKSILKKDTNYILNSIDSYQEKTKKSKVDYRDYSKDDKHIDVTFDDFKNQLKSLNSYEITNFIEENNDTNLKNYFILFFEFNLDSTMIRIRDKESIKFLLSFILMNLDK